MTISISKDDVLQQLEAAVALKGSDYTYSVDRAKTVDHDDDDFYAYEVDGQPSCIVGHVLIGLGVPAETFRKSFVDIDRGVVPMNNTKFKHIVHLLPIDISEGAKEILVDAQFSQDNGRTWGQAMDFIRAKA